MSLPLPSWVLIVRLEDDALALNRAVGIVRRRNLAITSISLGPSGRPGETRLTCLLTADEASVERVGNALRKMVGVQEALVLPESQCTSREHALIRVRVTPAQLGSLLDTAALYRARVIEEAETELVLEATATPPALGSLLRALEPFGLLDVARGGALALANPGATPSGHRAAPAMPRMATAIPA